jgi:predicted heme/steroid binding protein
MNKLKTFLLSISALLVLAACGDTATEDPAVEEPATETPATEAPAEEDDATSTVEEGVSTDIITQEELAEADGQDGNPAYVAINGVVYDVTDNDAWVNGEHQGLQAGQDYTTEIDEAPHGDTVLPDLPVVGTLEGAAE